jgi:hypothetical protein
MASWQRLAIERRPERKDQRFLTWIDIEPEPDAPPAPLERNAPAREEDFTVPPLPAPAPLGPASPAISAPPIDWRESMEAAAGSAATGIIRQESYRSLGPIERGKSGASPSKSIFEQPRRKAGDIDHDSEQGRTLIWHDEQCYTELKFPTLKDPNALVGAPNPPKCMVPMGKRPARGDLFDDLQER